MTAGYQVFSPVSLDSLGGRCFIKSRKEPVSTSEYGLIYTVTLALAGCSVHSLLSTLYICVRIDIRPPFASRKLAG